MKDPNLEKIERSVIVIQSHYRGYKVRLQNKEFFRKIKYRKFIIKEIIQFEKNYIDKIHSVLEYVKKPLIRDIENYKEFLTVEKVNTIFSNLDEILNLHCTIYNMFSNSPFGLIQIGKIYLEMLPKFIIYHDYVKNYNLAFKIYAKIESRIDFNSFIEGLYLQSSLISPIQHTPRYVLLFSDLTKNTNPQNEDHQSLQEALLLARKTAMEINACITASPQDQSDDDDSDNYSESSIDEEVSKTTKGKTIGSGNNSPHNVKVQGPFKRPASASSKYKPRNPIIMHKNANEKILSNPEGYAKSPYTSQDFSQLPSYLRPTLASMGWSRAKAEMPTPSKFNVSTNTHDKMNSKYTYTYTTPPTSSPPSELFIDRSTPKNKPDWKYTPRKDSSAADYFKLTKKPVSDRPTSPPPKLNFYTPSPIKSNSTNELRLASFSSKPPLPKSSLSTSQPGSLSSHKKSNSTSHSLSTFIQFEKTNHPNSSDDADTILKEATTDNNDENEKSISVTISS